MIMGQSSFLEMLPCEFPCEFPASSTALSTGSLLARREATSHDKGGLFERRLDIQKQERKFLNGDIIVARMSSCVSSLSDIHCVATARIENIIYVIEHQVQKSNLPTPCEDVHANH